MFRSIAKRSLLYTRSSPVYSQPASRSISNTSVVFKASTAKKLFKKFKQEDTFVIEDPSHVLPNFEAKLKESLEHHKKSITETKLGANNPTIFDKISVDTGKGRQIFTSVAQTAMKGRNLIITVFDPNNTKHVVSAILGSGLNINPEPDRKSVV